MIDATIPGVVEDHSPNFHAGRDGYAVLGVVIHVTEGSEESAVSWFRSATSGVSAHYLVAKDGTVRQFVAESDSANHCGVVDRPTAKLVLAHAATNPNRFLLGIEHEGMGDVDLTAAQRTASVALVRDVCRRHGIPIDRDHILRHHEIRFGKTCPGAIDVELLVAQAKWAEVTGAPPTALSTDAPRPMAVYSPQMGDWLVVTRYVNDAEWYYVPLKSIQARYGAGFQATTPLSHMPLRP